MGKGERFFTEGIYCDLHCNDCSMVLQSFDLKLNLVENSANSMLAMLSGLLVPVFRPLGLGDWRICTSLISGFMAKESVVATLEVLFGDSIATVLTPLAAATLLVFSLLYTPCVAAIASVRRELGGNGPLPWYSGSVLWHGWQPFWYMESECFWDENSSISEYWIEVWECAARNNS